MKKQGKLNIEEPFNIVSGGIGFNGKLVLRMGCAFERKHLLAAKNALNFSYNRGFEDGFNSAKSNGDQCRS